MREEMPRPLSPSQGSEIFVSLTQGATRRLVLPWATSLGLFALRIGKQRMCRRV